jgi:signal transduction histidine kinase
VENRRVQLDKLTENDTVVATAINAFAIVENILRVLPLTKTIAIVNGGFSANERFWLGEVRRELGPLAGGIELKWYNELSLEDILKDVANLPPHSAIYWGLMNVDAAGVVYETSAVLKKLFSSANAPIFTYDDAFFGEGIVGGPMQSIAERSRIAAAVAVRIFNGEKAGDIKTTPINLASPKFDWRQMQRWEITESHLPPGSAIYFREPPVWEKYSWQIALTTAIIFLQGASIAALLREHRRRQFAEVQSKQRMTELARVVRFSTAGELTASIAHEINQPLGSILTNTETVQMILKAPNPDINEVNEILGDILRDDRRATEVIRRMRSLLKKAPFELKHFDLNDLVRETVELVHTVGRKVELDSVITGDGLPIRGDRIQLQQVVLNLVTNGIDAMKDTPDKNRIITIRTSRVEDFAQLSVSDRGHGIPEDKLKEVFEPFYTSKAEGMGMGLSIARTIVEAHNGQLSAKNRDHGGATFRIRLPLV